MKFPILICTLLVVSTTVYAQNPRVTAGNPRTETYLNQKGGDSVRFVIFGQNDTIKVTTLYKNGQLEKINWRKDSTYAYDELGRLVAKDFYFYTDKSKRDSAIRFYSNGQREKFDYHSLEKDIKAVYNTDGQPTYLQTINRDSVLGNKISTEHKGVLRKIAWWRKLDNNDIIESDTLFYPNGKQGAIILRRNGTDILRREWFNEDGTTKRKQCPDTLCLIPFKDNLNCFYGLRNKRGDTIFKPIFDRIEIEKAHHIAAYTGENARLYTLDGKPIPSFAKNLKNIYETDDLDGFPDFTKMDRGSYNADIEEEDGELSTTMFFVFQDGTQFGVVDENYKIVVPPQKFKLTGNNINEKYFKFTERLNNDYKREGYVNRAGKSIFSDSCFVVEHFIEDYFKIGFAHPTEDNNINSNALANADGEIVLAPKFSDIKYLWDTNLCIAEILDVKDEDNETDFAAHESTHFRHGLFNFRTKTWLLDTSQHQWLNTETRNYAYFICKNLKTQKYGVIDSFGKWLTPQTYDYIQTINQDLLILVSHNKGQYQFADIKNGKIKIHKTSYADLSSLDFYINGQEVGKRLVYFLAKKGNKWGVVNHEDKILKAFDFDYATRLDYPHSSFGMVKKDKIFFFNLASLPYDDPSLIRRFQNSSDASALFKYETLDSSKTPFFVNKADKVVIPPQYKWVKNAKSWQSHYAFVENAQQKKQIIYFSTGEIVAFPFDYDVEIAPVESKFIVVKDAKTDLYGVVSKTGKVLVPCVNYSVAIGDRAASVFFVKPDAIMLDEKDERLESGGRLKISGDSLTIEDTNWQMYNGEGKILNNAQFRFPIRFNQGIGIGMTDEAYSLYDLNGTIVVPFDKKNTKKGVFTEGSPIDNNPPSVYPSAFSNITFDRERQFYTLFLRQGLTTTLMLTNAKGEVLVKAGHYDGISKFYGKYALVTDKKRVGLIDTLGNEIFAPQDLRVATNTPMDSLESQNKRIEETDKERDILSSNERAVNLPFAIAADKKWHPDSLNNEKYRTLLWNLMLEKEYKKIIETVNNVRIYRVADRTIGKIEYYFHSKYNESSVYPYYTKVSDNTCAFIFSLYQRLEIDYATSFHNFYRRNNRWENVELNDLLNIQGEKRQQINNLISQKVGNLKNIDIDCSDTSNFIGLVEKHFQLTKEGIDFCFFPYKNSGNLVIISFSWAELSPFLKMKF
jgi:hypothetical protein